LNNEVKQDHVKYKEKQAKTTQQGKQGMDKIKLVINGQILNIELEDNSTVEELLTRLPMTLSMDDLYGNEKYYYLDEGFPTNRQSVGSIQAGDIMLFGTDCIVIFYESFSTTYQYTRIGHISDSSSLKQILGNGNVEVTFEK